MHSTLRCSRATSVSVARLGHWRARRPSFDSAAAASEQQQQQQPQQQQQQQQHQQPVTLPPVGGNVAAAKLITTSLSGSTLARSAPYIIGVCGGTASGKTSVCNKLIAGLMDLSLEHHGILSLPQDCFYRDLTPAEAANIAAFNFDHPDAFAFNEIIDTLSSLKQQQPTDVPVYDFVTSARLPQVTHVRAADVIMFDGILSFYLPELRDLFDLKIFVDVDADTRLSRRMRRDILERGRDVIQVLEQYERSVKPSFEQFTLPSKKYADIIVPRGADNSVAIELLLQHIRLQLTGKHQQQQQQQQQLAAAAAAAGSSSSSSSSLQLQHHRHGQSR